MQDLLANKKRFYRKGAVRTMRMPLWPEMSLENQWQQAIQLPDFADYMPASWMAQPKQRQRSFFFSILQTLAPEYSEELIADCRQQRLEALEARIHRPQALVIAANWVGPLLAQPYVSSKFKILDFVRYLTFHILL